MSAVETYFKLQAPEYAGRMSRWPWSWIKRLESRSVAALLPDLGGVRALDAAAGTGYYSQLLLKGGARECLAVDLVEEMLDFAPHARIKRWRGDFAEFKDQGEFDVIVCAGGLEFFTDPEAFFRAAGPAASTGGKLVLLYPPRTFAGRLYRYFHGKHGFDIHLFDTRGLDSLAGRHGWRRTASKRAHPYAEVSLFERA